MGREPGEFLLSARDRTDAEWEDIKIDVGSRWWFAMYQGRPSPPEGGLFQRAWFERNRVPEVPEMAFVITMVDPADNTGDGDESGIVTGGVGTDGRMYVLADDSGHYTVARWVRVAIFAMIRHQSAQLAYERSLSGLDRSIAAEWKRLRRQARALLNHGPDLDNWTAVNLVVTDAAAEELSEPDDTDLERAALSRELVEMWPYVPAIMGMSAAGPATKKVTAKGSKSYRATMVSPTYEQNRVSHVGHMVKLEHQLVTWLPTQDSPDRMDALVHLITELSQIGGSVQIKSAPATNRLPSHQSAVPVIMRSTRR